MKTMISNFLLIPIILFFSMLLISCGGGGSSDTEKNPNLNIENGKIGDFLYIGAGQVDFPGEFCPSQNLKISGTGTVNKINDQYQVTVQINKLFTPTGPCVPTPTGFSDAKTLNCKLGDEVLNCVAISDADDYKFSIKLKTGAGIFEYSHHYSAPKGLHLGGAFGDINPTIWLGK